MAERQEIPFYLAGSTEDNSSVTLLNHAYKQILESGNTVVNGYRAKLAELNGMREEGMLIDSDRIRTEMRQAGAFLCHLGLRSFNSGFELGQLLGLNLPGLIVYESSLPPIIPTSPDILIRNISGNFDTEAIGESMRELINLLSLVPGSQKKIIRNGELSLFQESQGVTFQRRKINVGPYKFALLNELAGNIDQVVPYQKLDALTLNDPTMRESKTDYLEHRSRHRVQDNLDELIMLLGNDHRYFDVYHGIGIMMVNVEDILKKAPDGIVKNGNLVYDLQANRVSLHEQSVSLGYTHLRLLRSFMLNQETPFSYQELSEIGWGKAGLSATKHTIQKVVYQTRSRFQKLDPQTNYIDTLADKSGYLMPALK